MTANLTEFYGSGTDEDTRLTRSAHGKLEFLRTRELVRRALTRTAQRVLDVGGGTGVHARWLAADGHSVHVVDPVPRHVEVAAGIPGVSAELGDARALTWPDASADVVLLFGRCTTSSRSGTARWRWPKRCECSVLAGSCSPRRSAGTCRCWR
ncbi:class I SAM-dependent methyltransferase [Amycolatopsis sp. NPDC051372]|uniref:class I SAM-dependent methyltransferase n=1 Tax=Amycolatopsis sp. NPDC051372 TaxID=3155669 RepID=UPI00342EA6D0